MGFKTQKTTPGGVVPSKQAVPSAETVVENTPVTAIEDDFVVSDGSSSAAPHSSKAQEGLQAPTVKAAFVSEPIRHGPQLPLTKVGELLTEDGHLASASGVVRAGDFLIVTPDDQLEIGVFDAHLTKPGYLVRVFDGELVMDYAAKKYQKPDLEAATFLSPDVLPSEHGTVLALGSGSTDNRRRGALVELGADGQPTGSKIIDLAPLYMHLEKQFPELNIEGVTVVPGLQPKLRLLQRGNGADSKNAIIDLNLKSACAALSKGRPMRASCISEVTDASLGTLDGVPLTFTDAATLSDGRTVFTAAAEDTENTYDDGEIMGSAVGIMDESGKVEVIHPLDQVVKIEGVTVEGTEGGARLLLVTDADDAAQPAEVFTTTLPIPDKS